RPSAWYSFRTLGTWSPFFVWLRPDEQQSVASGGNQLRAPAGDRLDKILLQCRHASEGGGGCRHARPCRRPRAAQLVDVYISANRGRSYRRAPRATAGRRQGKQYSQGQDNDENFHARFAIW